MRPTVVPMLALAGVLSSSLYAHAATTAVWGFPLGATPDELRSRVGAPAKIQESTPAPSLVPGLTQTRKYEYWVYVRDGITYNVSFSNGVATTVSVNQMLSTSPALDQTTTSAAPADPLGLRIGDTVGAILIKSGAVDEIHANSGVVISNANVSVRRADLSYSFQVFNGRIESEWITLVH